MARETFFCPSVDLSADLEHPPAIPKSIVGGHFVERNLNLVVGQPGSYKTMVMLEIASAIAIGRPAFGTFPVEQGRVVFITGDDPREVLVDRLLMLNAKDVDGTRVLDPKIRWLLAQNLDVRPIDQVITAKNPGVRAFLKSTVDGAQFAIFDPMRHFIGQSDENKAHEIYEQLEPVRQMAENSGCAIALIHHSNKSTSDNKMNDYRGSGALRGLSRAQVNIERTNFGVDPPRISIVGENRYGAEPKSITIEIHKVGNTIQFVQPSLVGAIYNIISANGKKAVSTNEIAANFAEPFAAVRAALYRLRDKGLISSHKERKESVWVSTGKVDTSVLT